MRNGQTNRGAARPAAVVMAVSLALAVAGCGGGGDKSQAPPPGSPKAPAGSENTGASSSPESDDNRVLATIKGPGGVVFTINSAKREEGGFVNVTGSVKNGGSEPFSQAGSW